MNSQIKRPRVTRSAFYTLHWSFRRKLRSWFGSRMCSTTSAEMPTSHRPKLLSSGRVSSSLPELIQTLNNRFSLDYINYLWSLISVAIGFRWYTLRKQIKPMFSLDLFSIKLLCQRQSSKPGRNWHAVVVLRQRWPQSSGRNSKVYYALTNKNSI